ncbi:MAG: hypothetical protein D6732_07890 [Methanobacteriota archaeon]|nr:MAG: hypothetical protein D6732_07890 [Euryarchaeota archaeon]
MDRYIEYQENEKIAFVNEIFGLIDKYFELKDQAEENPKLHATLENIDLRFKELVEKIAH